MDEVFKGGRLPRSPIFLAQGNSEYLNPPSPATERAIDLVAEVIERRPSISSKRQDSDVAADGADPMTLQERIDRLEDSIAELQIAISRSPLRLISMAELERRLGLKKSAIYARLERKELPQPIKLGEVTRFVESEIEGFIEQRMRERDNVKHED